MKKITKFKDIPQLTRAGSCNTNIPLTHMLKTISAWTCMDGKTTNAIC